jgi:hypothetical protein
MVKFPVDAPKERVLRAFEALGFVVARMGNHIAMRRAKPDGGSDTLDEHAPSIVAHVVVNVWAP